MIISPPPSASSTNRRSASESVNHSRPSGPKARSLGPTSVYPASCAQTISTVPSACARWIAPTALRSPLPGTLPPWQT